MIIQNPAAAIVQKRPATDDAEQHGDHSPSRPVLAKFFLLPGINNGMQGREMIPFISPIYGIECQFIHMALIGQIRKKFKGIGEFLDRFPLRIVSGAADPVFR